MEDMIVSLLRVSPKIYNDILCKDHTLYMNPQLSFNNASLVKGQADNVEGAISKIPYRIIASEYGKNQWKELMPLNINYDYYTYKDIGIYIFCTYAIIYDKNNHNSEAKKYHAIIPWKYIEGFWKNELQMEMIIILKTETFLDGFRSALKNRKLTGGHGGIEYDLNKNLISKEYLEKSMCDDYDFVFHKNDKEDYMTQNEYRFFVQSFEEKEHYELELAPREYDIRRIDLEYGKSIELIYKGFGINQNQDIYFDDVSISLVD